MVVSAASNRSSHAGEMPVVQEGGPEARAPTYNGQRRAAARSWLSAKSLGSSSDKSAGQ